MKIAVGSDHAAYPFKLELIEYVKELGHDVTDLGTRSAERTDYPIYGEKVARAVVSGEYERGLAFCGTGVGISISANKVPGARAVVCSEPYSAMLSREHNNTNILSLGSRVVGIELAKMIIKIWLETGYDAGRHQRRLDMISTLEEGGTCG